MKQIIMAILAFLLLCGCSTVEESDTADNYIYPSTNNGECLVFYLIPDPVYAQHMTVSRVGELYVVKTTVI